MKGYWAENERAALDVLEPKFVSQGYRFIREPSADLLPPFFGRYRPDAIAIGKQPSVAIEIKTRKASLSGGLKVLRSMFEGRNDWTLDFYFLESIDRPTSAVDSNSVTARSTEIRGLAQRDPQAAFVLAWAVLEAAARGAGFLSTAGGTLGSVQLIGVLSGEGVIRGTDVSTLFELARQRNAIAHGQLDLVPSSEDVARVLDLVSVVQDTETEAATAE